MNIDVCSRKLQLRIPPMNRTGSSIYRKVSSTIPSLLLSSSTPFFFRLRCNSWNGKDIVAKWRRLYVNIERFSQGQWYQCNSPGNWHYKPKTNTNRIAPEERAPALKRRSDHQHEGHNVGSSKKCQGLGATQSDCIEAFWPAQLDCVKMYGSSYLGEAISEIPVPEAVRALLPAPKLAVSLFPLFRHDRGLGSRFLRVWREYRYMRQDIVSG